MKTMLALLFALALLRIPMQAREQKPQPQKQQQPAEQEPPEEDETLKPKIYAFNPIQAAKEMQVGDFYFKRHNYKGAASRFEEATKWNPGLADAFFRLGEAEEKLNDKAAAKQSYAKYLEMEPNGKDAHTAKKKLGRKD